MADPKGSAVLEQAMTEMAGGEADAMGDAAQGDGEAISDDMMTAMMEAMPLRQMISFVPGVTKDALNRLLMELNH